MAVRQQKFWFPGWKWYAIKNLLVLPELRHQFTAVGKIDDSIIFSGDLANTGKPNEYKAFMSFSGIYNLIEIVRIFLEHDINILHPRNNDDKILSE